MRARHIPAITIVGVLLFATACASPTGEIGSEHRAVDEPPASSYLADGGVVRVDAHTDRHSRDELGTAVQCVTGFDPFVCNGGCAAPEEGCCVTGVRPLGVCRTLDECTEQCAHDCGLQALYNGAEAGLQCEALCTWVAPEAECKATR